MTVPVFKKHKVWLCLQACMLQNEEEAKVCSVKLLTDSIVKGTVVSENDMPPVALEIPDLNDLVRLAESRIPIGDGPGFVIREAMVRINALEERAEELSCLQNLVLTRIGNIYHDDCFGGEDQEVVCSLNNEQITIVLRLTPICPLVKGSVYISELVGLGGWDPDELEKMKNHINNQMFRSPVAILHYLKETIKAQGIPLSQTPSLPNRNQA